MITKEQVQSILRVLKPSNIDIVDDVVNCEIERFNVSIKVSDFEEYLKIKEAIKQDSETCLSYEGYFECIVELLGLFPPHHRLFRNNPNGEKIALIHEQTGLMVELSPISPKFIMYLIDTNTMPGNFTRFLTSGELLKRKDKVTLSDLFSRILSVKVTTPTQYKNYDQLRSIAESSLYNISYGYGVGIVPVKSWERYRHRLITERKETVQFPLRIYKQELVAYYQMALGAESLFLSYLALYQILEYLFTSVSEDMLHKTMKEKLVSPDFSHTKIDKLRDLAKAIRKFDQKMDEKRMLQTVLEQYISKDELCIWLKNFNRKNSDYFNIERELFGDLISKIDSSDNQLFPTISVRIYHIRNALVHNKEGDPSRFTPFSGQEKILVNEAQLLLYISEQIILKTGTDINLQ